MLVQLLTTLLLAAYTVAFSPSGVATTSKFRIVAQTLGDVGFCFGKTFKNATVGYHKGFLGVAGQDTFKLSGGKLIDLSRKEPDNQVSTSVESPNFGALVFDNADSSSETMWRMFHNGTLMVELETTFSLNTKSNVSCSLVLERVEGILSGTKVRLIAIPVD